MGIPADGAGAADPDGELIMAKMTIDGLDAQITGIDTLETSMRRTGIRRIVEAGAKVAAPEMADNIQKYHHIGKTGDMYRSVGGAEYKETFEGGSMNVYPLGNDPRGVSNALKAFVINYGRGGNPTRRGTQNKTGDKFITGNFRKSEERAAAAMREEASAVLREATGQGG